MKVFVSSDTMVWGHFKDLQFAIYFYINKPTLLINYEYYIYIHVYLVNIVIYIALDSLDSWINWFNIDSI